MNGARHNFASAAVGDTLAVRSRHSRYGSAPSITHDLMTVAKITSTQLVCTRDDLGYPPEVRVRRNDGKVIGVDYTYAQPATPDLIEQNARERAAVARHRAAVAAFEPLLHAVERRKLIVEQMEALAAAYSATLAPAAA